MPLAPEVVGQHLKWVNPRLARRMALMQTWALPHQPGHTEPDPRRSHEGSGSTGWVPCQDVVISSASGLKTGSQTINTSAQG